MAGSEDKFPGPDNPSKMRRSVENAEHVGQLRKAYSASSAIFCKLTASSQGFSHLELVRTFATSNDDVGLSMIAALGMRRSRIRTKPVITTLGTGQMLFMRLAPSEDPEVPPIQAMEGLPHSRVEENRLAEIRFAREDCLMSKDLAIGLAASVIYLNVVKNSRN